MTAHVTDAELAALESHPDPMVAALASEVRRLRQLVTQTYGYVADVPGTEDLQAELEREVLRIRAARKG